ncbi:ABC transporter permease [Bradyrhizobium sp. LHD-71]|uniref:ABC transporter permease n=1 Tax=Bradyrhizobium sp. LHD-71 TaxID=3072141 RepID=UPI00280EA430|nr:ABC transporter permease [Bradyrhizobium sp. LHD-71]MDQ8729048.1 ABC transporter permease [Bradyrhizobium sp. LHD-71]
MARLSELLGRSVLCLPITVLIGVFFVVPMAMVLSLAFRPYDAHALVGTEFTLRNFTRFIGDPNYVAAFARTVYISAATTVLSVLLGYPVALHLHRVKSGFARLWLTLIVLLPLMISLVVASFAWMLLLGNNGVINANLIRLGLISQPIELMNTMTGVIIVGTFSSLSYPILTIFAALENIPADLGRSARIHGASDAQVFAKVLLPLSLPGVISGGLIVFALNMAAFVIPFLIGGGRVHVVPLMIYQFTLQLFDWPGAAALGVLLFALTLGCTALAASLAQRRMPWESA